MKKRYFILWIIYTAVAICLLFSVYIKSHTSKATSEALEISKNAQKQDNYLVFQAEDSQANLIFFGDSLVQIESYARLADKLSQNGITTYLIKNPLNIPILSKKTIQNIINKQSLSNIFLAGHSKGGEIASSEAHSLSSDDRFKGLILLASYPNNTTNLEQTSRPVLSITGAKDKIINWQKYDTSKKQLPSTTTYISLLGGNHNGFGEYHQQDNDGKALLTPEQQIDTTYQLIVEFIHEQLQNS